MNKRNKLLQSLIICVGGIHKWNADGNFQSSDCGVPFTEFRIDWDGTIKVFFIQNISIYTHYKVKKLEMKDIFDHIWHYNVCSYQSCDCYDKSIKMLSFSNTLHLWIIVRKLCAEIYIPNDIADTVGLCLYELNLHEITCCDDFITNLSDEYEDSVESDFDDEELPYL